VGTSFPVAGGLRFTILGTGGSSGCCGSGTEVTESPLQWNCRSVLKNKIHAIIQYDAIKYDRRV